MIKVDKLYEDFDDTLPISVVIPMSTKRNHFFYNMVYPLIEANRPAEIIVNDNVGGAPKKRNDGFEKSTQPFVFFCDDDILMPSDYLGKLYKLLQNNPSKAYAYTGYHGIVMHPQTHPLKGNFQIPSLPFNSENLRRGNYISTMALVIRECLPKPKPFDESLKRLQDWDLWLTMLKNGHEGIMLFGNENMYHAYYLDEGITSNNNNERENHMIIVNKHKLYQ
jgi:glycosyltransferase involved in cell wall biosynthesis